MSEALIIPIRRDLTRVAARRKTGSILSQGKGKINGPSGTLKEGGGFLYTPNRNIHNILHTVTPYRNIRGRSAGLLAPPHPTGPKGAACHFAINLAEIHGHEQGRVPVMAAVRTSKTKMQRFWAEPNTYKNKPT